MDYVCGKKRSRAVGGHYRETWGVRSTIETGQQSYTIANIEKVILGHH